MHLIYFDPFCFTLSICHVIKIDILTCVVQLLSLLSLALQTNEYDCPRDIHLHDQSEGECNIMPETLLCITVKYQSSH